MVATILNAFRVPEIRRKLAFTAAILALYRLGAFIPVPGVNTEALEAIQENYAGSNILGFLNLFTGGGLSRIAIFALGIMPYITASIILQLLTVVSPSLEKLQKEGEVGQQRITQYTRYLTVGLAAAQAIGYVFLFRSQGDSAGAPVIDNFSPGTVILIVVCLTAGCVLLMWMGELITQRGIGNGISLMIFASIVSGLPNGVQAWWTNPDQVFKVMMPFVALGGDRGDRVRAGGPAADPGAVRQARDRPPDELRRADLPAAAREHGGRHPGHLRRLDHGLPADDRRAAAGRAGPRDLLQPQRLGLHRRRDGLHHPLHVLLHGGDLQPGRPGRQPQEVRRLHPGGEARPPDGGVPGPHPRPADVPRRALPRGRRGPADHPHQPDVGELLLRRHVDPDRHRRGPGHDEAARGAADDAQLRRLLEVAVRAQPHPPRTARRRQGHPGRRG